jgi:hypothetical protein
MHGARSKGQGARKWSMVSSSLVGSEQGMFNPSIHQSFSPSILQSFNPSVLAAINYDNKYGSLHKTIDNEIFNNKGREKGLKAKIIIRNRIFNGF